MLVRRIAATILSGILTLVGIASFSAHAKDPELYFYPAKKWQITKNSASASDKPPVCTIASTFNNGFLLQFAGTADGFANLNIDFKQPTFEKGKKYEVQYSIPGESEDALPTSAFEKNLLVADMRGKSAFSQSLRSASVVDIKIQGNEFRFYLTGFEAAMKDFNNCTQVAKPVLAEVAPPVEAAPATPEVIAATPVNTASVETPKAKISGSSSDALKEIYAPAVSVSAPTAAITPEPLPAPPVDVAAATPEQTVADTPDANKDQTVASNQAEQNLYKRPRYTELLARQMKDENKKYEPLSAKSDAAPKVDNSAEGIERSNIPAPATNTDTETSKDAAHAPMKMTAADSAAATSDLPKPRTISTKIPAVIIKKAEPIKAEVDLTKVGIEQEMESIEPAAEANPLQETDAAVQVKEVDAPQAIEPLAEELANISPASGHSVDDFTDMRAKITEMEEQLAKLTRENTMLDEELKTTLKASEDERLSVSSDNWNLERATMRFNEAERQISRLGRQLQSAKAQCDAEKSDLEGMLFDPKLTDQQQLAKLSSLEEDLDETKSELQNQRRNYEERIRLLEAQLEKTP